VLTTIYGLNGLFAFFFGPDADGLFDGGDEDFAIADLTGLGRLDDGGYCGLQLFVGEDDFQFNFWQEVDRIFAAAIDFSMTFLAAEPFNFTDGHAFDPDFAEGILHFFELEWFYNGFDFFHLDVWGLVWIEQATLADLKKLLGFGRAAHSGTAYRTARAKRNIHQAAML
jgi:hypothetical protein